MVFWRMARLSLFVVSIVIEDEGLMADLLLVELLCDALEISHLLEAEARFEPLGYPLQFIGFPSLV
jgi:hypothetical protein